MVTYKVQVDLTLEPLWHSDPPEISVYIGDQYRWNGCLESTKTFCHQWTAVEGTTNLSVEFLNKNNNDTVESLDKAVIIKSLSLNGISSDRFLLQGIYQPIYPEPWATEQKNAGIDLPSELTNHTYLGWNGIWILSFDVPVFTWIHRVENLGWIYD